LKSGTRYEAVRLEGIGRIKRKVLNSKGRSNVKRPVRMVIRYMSEIEPKGIGIGCNGTIEWKA